MKPLGGMFVLGIGFWMLSGSPARAQVGGSGDGLTQGASDAAKQEVMKRAAEKAGLPTPGAPKAARGADGAASAPAGEPPAAAPGSDADAAKAPVDEPKAAPGVADAPTPAPAADENGHDTSGVGKMMPKLP